MKNVVQTLFKLQHLELTFRHACPADQMSEMEIIEAKHCIITHDDSGCVTKDIVKPIAERQFTDKKSDYQKHKFKSILFGEAIRLRWFNRR